jgi:hypothetical protein
MVKETIRNYSTFRGVVRELAKNSYRGADNIGNMESVTVKHIVTKRLQKNFMRLVFEIESKPGVEAKGELLLELRWFLGSVWNGSVGPYHLPSGFKKRFYVDIPAWDGIRWSKFKWVFVTDAVFQGKVSAYEGKGEKNKLYEDLRNLN